MEAATERDDPGPPGRPPSELECRLDRLRAGVEEDHRVEWVGKRGRELGRKPDGRLAVAHRPGWRDQSVDLLVDRGGHRGVVMAEGGDRDAVRKVEVRLAIDVKQAVALAVTPAPLEVATEDRRQARSGERGEIDLGIAAGRGHRVLRGAGNQRVVGTESRV